MRGEGRGDLEGAADAQPPDRARRSGRRCRGPRADHAAVGRELAVQHVEAGASCRRRWGRSAPAARRPTTREATRPSTACTPPNALCRPSTCSTAVMPAVPRRVERLERRRPGPAGRRTTTSRITDAEHGAPVLGLRATSVSCSQVKIAAPTTGPVSVSTPPSSTITSAVGRARRSRPSTGEMLPLEKAKSAPARPANVPASTKAAHWMRAHVDADRLGAQRRIAAGAQHVAERREQRAPQEGDAGAAQRQRQPVVGRLAGEPRRRPDADQAVAAAGELVPLEDDRPDDLREGRASASRDRRPTGARRTSRRPAAHRPATNGASTAPAPSAGRPP